MYRFAAELGAFQAIPPSDRCAFVLAWARALCTTDFIFLKCMQKAGTPVLPLYTYGQMGLVRYMDQTLGADEWLDIPAVLERGFGACEDFAAWRVAELVLAGENAKIDVDTAVTPQGVTLYHVVVRRGDGSREDPSKILGMQ